MRAPLRLLLLRLLLVAVFFNTAIGVPAHAIEHLREAQASLLDDDAPAKRAEAHTACAWCHSHAQLEHGLDAAPLLPCPSATIAGHAIPWRSADAALNAERWPFRSRDPPQA
ncbi:hypothetical protein [Pseudorhodoferax sp. Leaf265]|uniref:hypothetical protein n=1 Tax=Pseudorhodoferax sp. Leaf265 TaxID=1736315 RepID=UPI0007016C45|nr:hypothetical protein [Pseudorhodoferax sp. Leaf265]KQP17300.1 hypothetical protein ASF45_27735 [Pseudorhodoferax sp. Leaf265]PZQ00909.1 MAG: hypothetical protein DI583_06030 [Variovorax paradoxus]PZQ13791.1 MAG: hypothetical protein DI587_06030 [Variovorax paradoxus]